MKSHIRKNTCPLHSRVYISGPMSGRSREDYARRFMIAETVLRAHGYQNIVNPSSFPTARFPWLFRLIGYKLTLFIDLWILTRCDRIYKMPDWKESRGAQIESCVAFHFGVYTLDKNIRTTLDNALAEKHPSPANRQQTRKNEKAQ